LTWESGRDEVLCWSSRWRISSLAWEEDLVSELGTLVAVIYSSEGEKDYRIWKEDRLKNILFVQFVFLKIIALCPF